jgi:hypothetical protein
LPSAVAHRDLRFRIRAQELEAAVAAHLALALHEAMRVVDRERHQRRRFVARVAEHQALVARALVQVVVGRAVHALRDVRRLAAVAHHDGAAVGVEAQLGIVVADASDRFARDARVVDVRAGGDLAGHHDEAGRHERLRGDPSRGSCSRIASSTASEIWSATLSG